MINVVVDSDVNQNNGRVSDELPQEVRHFRSSSERVLDHVVAVNAEGSLAVLIVGGCGDAFNDLRWRSAVCRPIGRTVGSLRLEFELV